MSSGVGDVLINFRVLLGLGGLQEAEVSGRCSLNRDCADKHVPRNAYLQPDRNYPSIPF